MTINTKNGPMLLDVGKHMQCQQCHSQNLHMLASCHCKVPVGGMKDGVYYSGTVTVKRTDKDPDDGAQDVQSIDNEDTGTGCRTRPMHLRVNAKGSFLDGLPVFAGDPRTEMMLAQLLAYFGPEANKGLVLDGTLTCRQQWDLEHPDYNLRKPGYPSDAAVKIPYGSRLLPLKEEDALSPYKTDIPVSLRQKYGGGKATTKLRRGLIKAEESPLFQRDSVAFRRRTANKAVFGGSSHGAGMDDDRKTSMRGMLQTLADKVDRIAQRTSTMDDTLGKVRRVMRMGRD